MWFLQLMRSAVLINVFFWALALSVSVAGSNSTLSNRPFSNNVRLKILPLGDSITFGFQSTDGNGYRKHLLDKITTNGTAQYVGSVRSGNMTDNHNEGHPGATITQIGNFSRGSLTLRPNLILLMAGTNDMNMNLSVGATERLENLIDMCSTTCPDAVILVTQLSPAAPRDVEARIEQFNPTVIRLVANREGRGMKVAVVDMPKFVTTADLKDELHPNDIGYAKMADAWFEGIQKATTKGWFTPPIDANGPPQVVGVASVASATRSYLAPTPSLTTSSINTTANPSRFAAFAIPSNVSGPTSYFLPMSSPASLVPSTLAALVFSTSSVPMASQTATNDARMSSRRVSARLMTFVGLWLLIGELF